MSTRPELNDLKPGDLVFVERSSNDMRRRAEAERYIPARVVKASRVWIELKTDEEAADAWRFISWRMRRDTQNAGTQYSGSNVSFVTPAQREHDEARRTGRAYLKDQGIYIATESSWYGREAELAALIQAGA